MSDSLAVATPALAVPGLDTVTRDRALRWSIIDGAFNAVMVGVGESYLGALAVELGHRDTELAVLLTLPLLAGALAQLASSTLARWLGSRKRVVLLGASVQALSHLGFIAIAATQTSSFWALLSVKFLFWVSGSLAVPAWGAWMATLTEGISREQYFGRRSAVVQGVLLFAFAAGGWMLHRAQAAGASHVLPAFVLLHGVALAARVLSTSSLAMQFDSPVPPRRGSTLAALVRAARTSSWQTPVYLATLMFGAYVAVPFFTPYMIRVLGLGYSEFALLTAAPILVKVVSYPLFHRFAERFGLRAMLVAACVGISLVSLLWAVSRDMSVLMTSQALSGIAWGALEYSSFQLLLFAAHEDSRLEFLSLANSLNGAVQLVGALAGGLLIRHGGFEYQSIFLISAVGRALPLLFIVAFIPKQVSQNLPRLLYRLTSVRPAGGMFRRPAAIFFARKRRTHLETSQ
ncbi:MAG: MFS transporter [Polyangiales bacterium]